MNYEIRKLTREDKPEIEEIVKDMPHYFQRVSEYANRLIDDPKGYFYGAFFEDKLVGLGNYKLKTPYYAWIESIRVPPNKQMKGLGTALFTFGVQKAQEDQIRIIAFATEGSNHGSCKIGKKLGFELIAEMMPLWMKPTEMTIDKSKELKQQPITIEEAFAMLKRIPNGIKEDICLGWDYVPLDKEYFEQLPEMKFYAIEDTILLEYKEHDKETNEISRVKAIIYGTEKHIEELLYEYIRRNDIYENMICIVHENLVSIPSEMGFEHSYTDEGKPNKILLWKKVLIEK
ncbi:MAG: GNAT family N-acetyltransferase [Candidatus Heimdallarchaeota archaeon]